MKTPAQCRTFTRALLAAVLLTATGRLAAQDATAPAATTPDAAPAAPVTLAPQLSYGVSSIVQLSQANVGDATIVKYIQTGGSGFGLNADQIIYLKQQGVSDTVVNAMLNQPSQASAGTVATAAPAGGTAVTDFSTPAVNANYTADAAPAPAPVAAPNPAPIPPVSVYVIPAPPTTTLYTPATTPYLYYHPGIRTCGSVSVVYIGTSCARPGGYRSNWRH